MTHLPKIPGFTIKRLLGEGAAGRVYLAHETEGLRRPIALKVFSADHRDASQRELNMARRIEELRRRERKLELVQSLGTGDAGGEGTWLALEYLEDGSLADLIAKEGPLGVDAAVEATRAAGSALDFLHGEGLFHRDVKPGNLLRGSDCKVRLGDFGLSRELDGTLSAAGSPAFAAPEVIAGRATDGRLVDIYSLGATLAYLLTGEVMLPGKPDAFLLERRGVPRGVQEAILLAMAYSPEERPRDITAFLAALSRNADSARVLTEAPEVTSEGDPTMKSKQNLSTPAVALGESRDNRAMRVRPQAGATRCPYCHDECLPEVEIAVCRTCLSRHHTACWEEGSACANCGANECLNAPSEGVEEASIQPQIHWLGATKAELGLWALLIGTSGLVLGLNQTTGAFKELFSELGLELPYMTKLVLLPAEHPLLSTMLVVSWVASAALFRKHRTKFLAIVLSGVVVSILALVVGLFLPLVGLLEKL